jgi:subtilisin family serine protease
VFNDAPLESLSPLLSRVLSVGELLVSPLQVGPSFRFAGVKTTNVTKLRALSQVRYVEQNHRVFGSQVCNTQNNAPWGADRVDHRGPFLSGEFDYSSDGTGVTAYVIDTGINIEHREFGGRARWGTNTIDSSDSDGNGHGTHVAGTIGGKTYGIAKNVKLVAVKVLNAQGSGTGLSVMQGIAWSAEQHKKGDRSVLNLSLGGGKSQAENDACDAAVDAGVIMVVAAGNEKQDACRVSPASAAKVISVGATLLAPVPPGSGVGDDQPTQRDARASFSNFGTCVKIFAPGSLIKSAWIGSATASNTISGTSMASPHVAGVVASYWSASPSASNLEIEQLLLKSATPSIIDLSCASSPATCKNSPNLMLHLASCADKL